MFNNLSLIGDKNLSSSSEVSSVSQKANSSIPFAWTREEDVVHPSNIDKISAASSLISPIFSETTNGASSVSPFSNEEEEYRKNFDYLSKMEGDTPKKIAWAMTAGGSGDELVYNERDFNLFLGNDLYKILRTFSGKEFSVGGYRMICEDGSIYIYR